MKQILFFCFFLILVFVNGVTFGQIPQSYPFGNGTSGDPYIISSADNLAYLRDQVNSGGSGEKYAGQYFKVTADLDLSAYTPWTPIGMATFTVGTGGNTTGLPTLSTGNYFAGVFDGGGYTISNMTINATATVPTGGNVGLFGIIGRNNAVVPAEIRNVALAPSCSVNCIAAVSSNTTIRGIGSLVGYMYNCALVEQCYSLAEVTVTAPAIDTKINAGGLIGCAFISAPQVNNRNMDIKKCFFGGHISGIYNGNIGGNYVGGIVGMLDLNLGGSGNPSNNFLRVNECFNFGYVNGNNFVGGVTGSAYMTHPGNVNTFFIAVTNCYNSGMVSGNASSATTANSGGVGGIIGFAGTLQGCPFVMTHNYNTGGVRLTGSSANEMRLANCIGAYDRPTNNNNTFCDINYNFCDILNALTCNIVGRETNTGNINMSTPIPNVTSEMIGNTLIDNASSGLQTISTSSNGNFPITTWYGKDGHYPQLDWATRFATLNPALPAAFSEMIQAASALSVLPVGVTYYKDRYDVRYRSYNISGTCYVPLITADERPVSWATNQPNVNIDNSGELSILSNYSGAATLTASITLSSTNETLSIDYPVEINNPEGKTYIQKPSWVDAAWDGTAVAGVSPGMNLTGRNRLQQFGKWMEWPTGSTTGFFNSPTADLENFCSITNVPQIYEIWYPAQLRALYALINMDNIGTMNNYQFYIMQDLDMGNEDWLPIGSNTSTNYFAGYLDGNENKITNLNVNNSATIPVGLFSYIGGTSTLNAHIANLTISGNITSTQSNVGGLAGQVGGYAEISSIGSEVNINGTSNVGGVVGAIALTAAGSVDITFVHNKGTVSGSGTGIGGIVGSASTTVNMAPINIINAFNYGSVTGNTAGGIVGSFSSPIAANSTFEGCYNTAIIKGLNTVGGLAGTLQAGATLSNGYNVGNVYATAAGALYIGGIVGALSNSSLNNTYNGSWVGAYVTTSVNNSATNTGAVVGSNSGGTLSNNYYDAQMSNYYKGVGNGSNGSDIAGVAGVSNTIPMTQSSGFGLGSSFFHQAGYYPQLNVFHTYSNPTYPHVEQDIREASALSVAPAFLTNLNVAEAVDLDFIVRSNTASNTPITYTPHSTTKIINQGTTSTVVLDVAPVPHLEPILASASGFTRPIEVWNIKESETRRPWWAYDGRVWGGNVIYPEDNDMDGGYSSTTATFSADLEHPPGKRRQEYALYPYECFGYWDESEHEFVDQGSGTDADPYKIYYPAQLITISRIVNRQESDYVDYPNLAGLFIKVMVPLDFGGTELDANDVPQPIARNTFPIIGINGGGAYPDCYSSDPNPYPTQMNFSGVFDGGGFVMEGIYIAQESFTDDEGVTHYFNDTYTSTIDDNEVIPVVAWGLFGDVEGYTGGDIIGTSEKTVASVNSGVIRYVALSENCIISGEGDFTGSIVGRLNGTLTDCFNYASVSTTSGRIGGLAGAVKPYFGYSTTGCGAAYPQFIQNSFNRGHIYAPASATAIGGIVGGILENPSSGANGVTTINQVYNTAPIMASASGNVGGLTGTVDNTQTNFITNSFNAGMIMSAGNNVGGLAGSGNTGLTIDKSYSSGTIVNPGQSSCVSEYEGSATCRGSIIGNLNGSTLSDLFYDKQMSPYHKGIGCDGGSSDFDGSDITALTTGEFTGKTNPTTYANVKTALDSTSYHYKEDNYFSYYPQLTYFYESANPDVENPIWDWLMQLNSGLAAAPIYINEDPYQDVSEVTQDFEFPRANGNDLDTHLIWEATTTASIELNITGGYIHLPKLAYGFCPRITLTASVSGIPDKIFMFILKKEQTQRPWWAYPNRVWGGNCVYVTQDYTQAMKMGDGSALDIGGLHTGEPIVADLYGLKEGVLTKGVLNISDGILYEDTTPLDPLQETCQRHDQLGYWLDGMEDFSGAKHGLNENDPITIYYPAQLAYIANNVNAGSTLTEGLGFINWNHETYYGFAGKYITQMAILDMGGLVYEDAGSCNSEVIGFNECNAFTPIGLGKLNGSTQEAGLTGSDVFRGSYNGNGYYLRNLYINDNENKYVGLFGIADGVEEFAYDARINHLFLASGSVNSSEAQYTGSIVGWAGPHLFFDDAINVANVTATKVGGGITDDNSRVVVGGIIGTSHSTLTHCGNLGNVSGVNADATGGIAGYMHNDEHGSSDLIMSQCQNYGVINGKTNTGGIVGYFDVSDGGATATIEGSFVKHMVKGQANVGGIVGQTTGAGNHIINDCYMYAAVKFNNVASPEYIGSIVGRKEGANPVLSSNFYSTQHSRYQGEGLSDGSYGTQSLDDGMSGILGDINSSMYLNTLSTPPWAQLFGYYPELDASRNSDLADIYYGLQTNAYNYNRLVSGFSAIYSLPLYLADDELLWNLTKDFELPSIDYPGVTNLYPSPYHLNWSAYLTSDPNIPFGEITGTAPSQIQPALESAPVYTLHLPLTTHPVTFDLFVTDDNAGPECTHRELLELTVYKNTDTTEHRICSDSLLVLAPYFYEDPNLMPYTFQWYELDEFEAWNMIGGSTNETFTVDVAATGEYVYKCEIKDKNGAVVTHITEVTVVACMGCSDPAILKINKLIAATDCGFSTYTIKGTLTGATDLYVKINGTDTELIPLDSDNFTYSITVAAGTPVSLDFTAPSTDSECPPAETMVTLPK